MWQSSPERERSFFGGRITLDVTRLKRVGVVTYFGVYALVLFGLRHLINAGLAVLPAPLRPPPLLPIGEAFGLPPSVAMGLFSLSVALSVLGVMVAESVAEQTTEDDWRALGEAVDRGVANVVGTTARVRRAVADARGELATVPGRSRRGVRELRSGAGWLRSGVRELQRATVTGRERVREVSTSQRRGVLRDDGDSASDEPIPAVVELDDAFEPQPAVVETADANESGSAVLAADDSMAVGAGPSGESESETVEADDKIPTTVSLVRTVDEAPAGVIIGPVAGEVDGTGASSVVGSPVGAPSVGASSVGPSSDAASSDGASVEAQTGTRADTRVTVDGVDTVETGGVADSATDDTGMDDTETDAAAMTTNGAGGDVAETDVEWPGEWQSAADSGEK